MTYPFEQAVPSTAHASRRPGVVNAAATLLVLMAIAGLAAPIAILLTTGGTVERFRANAGGTGASQSDIDELVAFVRALSIVGVVLGAAVAVVLVMLALGNLRGSAGTRIATWIVCGLGLACGCCSLGTVIVERTAPLVGASGQVTADLLRSLTDAYPSWWVSLGGVLAALQTLGYVSVALLLALPAARGYYRRRPPAQWQPPYPMPYHP